MFYGNIEGWDTDKTSLRYIRKLCIQDENLGGRTAQINLYSLSSSSKIILKGTGTTSPYGKSIFFNASLWRGTAINRFLSPRKHRNYQLKLRGSYKRTSQMYIFLPIRFQIKSAWWDGWCVNHANSMCTDTLHN